MIPTKLTIQGIFSYQKEQTIEFANLINDQIFGIFGSVGSGKSSILEAITFSLYGKLEKMNYRDGINYNLMNLKSNSLLIDFEFSTSNNERYRFVVSGKRNSKNFEDVGTLEKKQYKWINNKWVKNEYSAEEILGLSYDNFKRTIIIPQGKFMEFLQLGDKDRTNMLKDIFNLGKFDLANKVVSFEKENNSHIDNLTGRLEGFKETNEDEITRHKNVLIIAEKDKKTLTNSSDKKNKEFKELEKAKLLFEEYKQAEVRFNNLNIKKEKFAEIENKINLYEYCLTNFKPLLDNKTTAIKKETELSANLKNLSIELSSITKLIKEHSIVFEQTKKEFNNIDKYKIKVEDIGKLIELAEQKRGLINIEKRISTERILEKELINTKTDLDKNIDAIKNQILDIEKGQKDISELSKIKEWFINRDNIEREFTTQRANLLLKKQELDKLNITKHEIISKDKQEKLNIDFNKKISEITEVLNSKITDFDEKLLQAKHKRDELIIKKKLEEFSANLVHGKACPVCGSSEHPNPINFDGIKHEITKLNSQTKNGEKYIASLRNYISEYKVLETKINGEIKNINEIETVIKTKETELNNKNKTFNWKNYTVNDKARIKDDFDKAEQTIKLIKTNRQKLDKETNRQNELTELISKKKEEINSFLHKKLKLDENKSILLSQINNLNVNSYEKKTITELKYEQNTTRKKIITIEANYGLLDKKIEELKLSEVKNTTEISNINKQLINVKKEIIDFTIKIVAELSKAKYKNVDLVVNILKKKFNIVEEKQKIKEFSLKLNTEKTIITKLKEQIKDKTFDKNKYQNILKEIKELSNKIEEINNKIGGLEAIIKQLIIDIKQKKELKKQLEIKNDRAADLRILKKLFKGSGFVQYVSTVYLQQLIDYANMRFHKLTKQSLSLVLGKNNNFDVIDYLNGGKRRSVKTLSGGQTFQASLSLALALAGSVQKLNKSDKNFFFLDEGFGTQDEESLRLVFEAIKSLRKENRIVGIISHVDNLKDEITTHLRIINDEKKGSLIAPSW